MSEFNPFDGMPEGLNDKEKAEYIVNAMVRRNKEIEDENFKPLRDLITYKDKDYLVSTIDTFDVGLETMIFPVVNNEIICMEVYGERHETIDEAIRKHTIIANNPDLFIK